MLQQRKLNMFGVMNMSYNFKIVSGDTDGITFCKPDGLPFTKEEETSLLSELNAMMPEKIVWDTEGQFHTIVVFRAKNYILYDGKKITYKGSAVKASTKEPALKQFIKDIIDEMLNGSYQYTEVYHKYIKEIMQLTDITRWASRKTITSAVMAAKRTNELIVKNAIEGTEYVEGDRAYFFYKTDGTLSLAEHFKGDYDALTLIEKLYKTAQIFNTVIPKDLFLNYSLKRNLTALNELIVDKT